MTNGPLSLMCLQKLFDSAVPEADKFWQSEVCRSAHLSMIQLNSGDLDSDWWNPGWANGVEF